MLWTGFVTSVCFLETFSGNLTVRCRLLRKFLRYFLWRNRKGEVIFMKDRYTIGEGAELLKMSP